MKTYNLVAIATIFALLGCGSLNEKFNTRARKNEKSAETYDVGEITKQPAPKTSAEEPRENVKGGHKKTQQPGRSSSKNVQTVFMEIGATTPPPRKKNLVITSGPLPEGRLLPSTSVNNSSTEEPLLEPFQTMEQEGVLPDITPSSTQNSSGVEKRGREPVSDLLLPAKMFRLTPKGGPSRVPQSQSEEEKFVIDTALLEESPQIREQTPVMGKVPSTTEKEQSNSITVLSPQEEISQDKQTVSGSTDRKTSTHKTFEEQLEDLKADLRENPYKMDKFIPLFQKFGHKQLSEDVIINLLQFVIALHGADIVKKVQTYVGKTLLQHALMENLFRVAQYLLNQCADFTVKDSNDDTPLHIAALKGDYDTVQLLIEIIKNSKELTEKKKIELINAKNNKFGCTPLLLAAANGHKTVVELLLRAGANINEQDQFGWTPLHWAIVKKHKEVVELLLRAGADPFIINSRGITPIHLAIQSNNVQLINLFTTWQDGYGNTLLHLAIIRGRIDMVRFLLENEVDPFIINSEGITPIHLAIQSNNAQLIILFTTWQDENGNTILHLAAEKGRKDIIQFFLRRIDVNTKNQFGCTALHSAVSIGNSEIVELLLNNCDTDPLIKNQSEIENQSGMTPIHLAFSKHDVELMNLFTTWEYTNGQTLLHLAAQFGFTEEVEFLLKNGAKVNVKDNKGNTPLHLAVWNGQVEIIKLLFRNGAKVNVKNNCHETPLQLSTGNVEIEELLRRKGAKG